MENEKKDEQEVEETAEEQSEEQSEEEEILTDEQLETAREVERYQSKIKALDEQLAEFRAGNIEAIKREEMKASYYTDSQIERYVSHIEGETADEIRASVFELTQEIPVSDPYGDPSAFNGAKDKPKTADYSDIGRKAFDRVKHKVFPYLGGRK